MQAAALFVAESQEAIVGGPCCFSNNGTVDACMPPGMPLQAAQLAAAKWFLGERS